jgi:hypothetical protein
MGLFAGQYVAVRLPQPPQPPVGGALPHRVPAQAKDRLEQKTAFVGGYYVPVK